MTSKKLFSFCLFTLLVFTSYSQIITGKVVDKKTNLPLEGVSVYFDGTTIGVITNENGFFNIESDKLTQASLVISFLGYKTKIYSQEEAKNIDVIQLEEKITSLDEVLIQTDNWSREKKINIFKREFLGRELASTQCKILNEDDIELVYSTSKNTLFAYCDKPIIIRNKYLGYRIKYNLIDFEVKFKQSLSGLQLIESIFYSGTSIFYELNKKVKNKHEKARHNEYNGSVLHFMRALAKKQLIENNFETFIKDSSENSSLFFPVAPYTYLFVEKLENLSTSVTVKDKKLVVLFNKNEQSSLIIEDENKTFYIDEYGVHSPANKLYFGGNFGVKRISTMLPSNFDL